MIDLNTILNELTEDGEQQTPPAICFYPGGFKPPHEGHFEVVKKTLQDYPEITKFYIVIGGGVRNGITQNESITIWEIYKPYLSDKVEVIKNKEYSNTTREFYILISKRKELIIKKIFYSELINGLKYRVHNIVS